MYASLKEKYYLCDEFTKLPRKQRKDISTVKGLIFDFDIKSMRTIGCKYEIPFALLTKYVPTKQVANKGEKIIALKDKRIFTVKETVGYMVVLEESNKLMSHDGYRVLKSTNLNFKYMIGDKVKISEVVRGHKYADKLSRMTEYIGQTVTIAYCLDDSINPVYQIEEDGVQWFWFEDMFESKHIYTDEQKLEAMKIICDTIDSFHDDDLTTTFTHGGSVGHAQCSPDDEFSSAIGMMVAMCRALGKKLPDWL